MYIFLFIFGKIQQELWIIERKISLLMGGHEVWRGRVWIVIEYIGQREGPIIYTWYQICRDNYPATKYGLALAPQTVYIAPISIISNVKSRYIFQLYETDQKLLTMKDKTLCGLSLYYVGNIIYILTHI